MSTLGTIKTDVTTQLGGTDGALSVPKRDRAINRARRQYYSAHKWSFCFKSSSVTITAQLGDMPATYNEKFDPERVYAYIGTVKYDFDKVAWDDLDSFTGQSYVYALNKDTGKIKINQTTFASVTVDYYQLPADAPIDTTQDATTELAPDVSAIVMLSIALWWLGKERKLAQYQLFRDDYKEQLTKDIRIDAANHPTRPLNLNKRSLGYTNRSNQRWQYGYTGRQ